MATRHSAKLGVTTVTFLNRQAVSVALGWHSPIFLKSLEPWLRPGSVVVTEDTKFEVLQQQGFTVHSGQSAPKPGPDLVHAYLKRRLTDLFGRLVVNQLKLETVQGFLDELQWRERFGVDPKQSFWSIMTDLLEHSGWKGAPELLFLERISN